MHNIYTLHTQISSRAHTNAHTCIHTHHAHTYTSCTHAYTHMHNMYTLYTHRLPPRRTRHKNAGRRGRYRCSRLRFRGRHSDSMRKKPHYYFDHQRQSDWNRSVAGEEGGIHTYIHAYIHTYIHTFYVDLDLWNCTYCTYIYAYAYTHTYIYTHIHIHTHAGFGGWGRVKHIARC
jgi:hypothetical protein